MIEVHDVVQIAPHLDTFGGCYMTVTEVKSWGVQGFVLIPGKDGRAYYRARFEDVERIGPGVWAPADEAEEGNEPTPDIGDGQPEEPPYVLYTDYGAQETATHWKEPVVWQALYRAVRDGRTDTAERIWDQLPREGRRMHLPGLWGQPETRAWLEEKGVDIEMRWEDAHGEA